MQKQERIEWLDCFRALLIIAMVFGHTGSPFNTYIYLAHMPGFLVASGFISYTSRKKHNMKEYMIRRTTSILIPAILINCIFCLGYWFAMKCGVYSIIQEGEYTSLGKHIADFFLNLRTEEIGGATWFLFVLFEVEVIFTCIDWVGAVIKNKFVKYGLCLIGGLVGYHLSVNKIILPYLLDLALLALLYYGIGYTIAEKNVLDKIERNTMLPICLLLTVFFGSFWFKGRLPMNWPTRQFADLFIQIVSCFACLYLIYQLAIWISNQRFAKIFNMIGKKTYCILQFLN